MELKEGYKKTEVGIIPEDWEVVTLEKISEIKTGPFGSALHEKDYVADGTPIITVEHLSDFGIVHENLPMVSDFDKKRLKSYSLETGDIVFSRVGSVDRNSIIGNSENGWLFSGRLLRIKVNDKKIFAKYLSYYFQQEYFKQRIRNVAVGQTMASLNTQILKGIKVILPLSDEQTAIATALSDTDALIASLEKLIAKKRLIKQGAMQKLLIPKEDWQTLNLGKIAILKARIGWQGLTTSEYLESGDYLLITGTEFKNGFIDWDNCFYVDYERFKQDKNIQIKKNDVLVTKDGTIGKVAFIDSTPLPATLNSGVFVIRPIENSFYPEYFYYLLMSSHFSKYLSQLVAGSTITHLYQKDFIHYEFRVPPTIEEQKEIAAILSDMDSEIEALETKLAKYTHIRQGMMQQLLSGKIRLVKPEEEEWTAAAEPEGNYKKKEKRHNEHFNDAVLIGTMAKEFGSEEFPLTRFMYTKVSYLLKRYKEERAEGYLKKAAGPYKPQTRYGGAETIALNRKYVKKITSTYQGKKYENFLADDNSGEAVGYYRKWYGEDALEWIRQFKFVKRNQLELWATVDMAMEDLKRERKLVNVETVKQLINNHKEWRPKLKRPVFSDENIKAAIIKSGELFG